MFLSAIANAGITDVNIVPTIPAISDSISIMAYGVEGSGGVEINDTVFTIDGYSLQLDMYLNVGICQVATPWSYTEDIGILAAGSYELIVNRYLPSYFPPPIIHSYTTDFTVVPEPGTLAIFGFGLPLLRAFSRRKNKL